LEGELLGVGPICEPVGVGASLIARSGPPGVGASRKVLGLCFARGPGDIEGWAHLVEERIYRGKPIDTTSSGPSILTGRRTASSPVNYYSCTTPRMAPKRKKPASRPGVFPNVMVPKAGLEPARALARHPLKMVCLPDSTTSARLIVYIQAQAASTPKTVRR